MAAVAATDMLRRVDRFAPGTASERGDSGGTAGRGTGVSTAVAVAWGGR